MPRRRTPKTCKKCGMSGLWWKSYDGSWRLSNDDGGLHICDGAAVAANAAMAPPAEFNPVVVDQPDDEPEPMQLAQVPSGADAGATLYSLIRPHVQKDIAAQGPKAPAQVINNIIVQVPNEPEPVAVIEGAHKQTATLIKYLSLGLNVAIVGPAQSGKTHACQIATEAIERADGSGNLPHYALSVGAQTSKTDLLGYTDAHGKVVRTILREAYENGGGFLLDEMDAGNANVLTILNAATANGHCSFPDGMIKQHPDWRIMAAMNTFGNGASRVYVGRNQLDKATTKRFVWIDWDYDTDLELRLAQAYGKTEWANYIHQLRRAQAATGIRELFTMRDIITGCRMLNAGISRAEVENAILWIPISADDKAKLLAAVR